MSTKTNYKVMTDAELIDEGLDCDAGSLAHTLADRLDELPISGGSVQIDNDSCKSCSDLQDEINNLENEVSSLQSDLENLDMDRLIAGVKGAKEAVKSAQKQVSFILGLGGDNHE